VTNKEEARKRETQKARSRTSKPDIVGIGSNNECSATRFLNTELRLVKARLAGTITKLIQRKGLDADGTAQHLDIPKISTLMRCVLARLSVARLFVIINRLGHDVEVRIPAKETAPAKTHTRPTIVLFRQFKRYLVKACVVDDLRKKKTGEALPQAPP